MPTVSSLANKVDSPAGELGLDGVLWSPSPPLPTELRPTRTERSLSDDAAERLNGMVWERLALAVLLYRAVLWLGVRLARRGVSANALTYASLVTALLAATAAGLGWFWTATMLVLGSGLFDLLDGVVARAAGSTNAWGALLDSVVDRLADALPLVGIMVFYARAASQGWLVAVAALIGMFLLSYVRARAESLKAQLPPLFMRRAERLMLLAGALLLSYVPVGIDFPAPLLLVSVGAIGLMSYVGAFYAMLVARRHLQ